MSRKSVSFWAGILLTSIFLIPLFSHSDVQANDPIIGWPLDNVSLINGAGYAVHNSSLTGSNCVGLQSQLYHAGVDLSAAPDTPVKAIYDGVVRHLQTGDYPGWAIVIEHNIDGNIFYSQIGHLKKVWPTGMYVGKSVVKGETVGWVMDYPGPGNNHIHFEIRSFLTPDEICADIAGPGYTLQHPDLPNLNGVAGYTDPAYFINAVNGNINNVELFEHSLFRGASEPFSQPLPSNVNSLNDMASSIAIPSGASVTLWQHVNQSGESVTLSGSDINFDNNTYPNGAALNDSVSSLTPSSLSCVVNGTCEANPAPQVCEGTSHDVVVWEHGGYYGQCVGFSGSDLSQTYNNDGPNAFGISAIYVNQSWLQTHKLHVYDELNLGSGASEVHVMVPISSIPNLADFVGGFWNDNVLSMHNTYTGWLTNFSIADDPPLGTTIDVSVEDNGIHGALRVCFNGGNCQETGALSLSYYWPTYLEEEGAYAITVEKRDVNQTWAQAVSLEFAYYLNKNEAYTACGLVTNGITMTSGGDCLGVLADVGDFMPVGWNNRSDLYVCSIGDTNAWVYDGVQDPHGNYQGVPKVVTSGNCMAVGSNVSSVDLKDASAPPPSNPWEEFPEDAYSVFRTANDSDGIDSIGGLTPSVGNGVSLVPGKFGNAYRFPNPTDGPGLTYPAINVCPMSFEAWVNRDTGSTFRVAGQAGRWILSIDGNKPKIEVWQGTGSMSVTGYQTMAENTWHYVMWTYNCDDQVVLYMDQELVGSFTLDAPWASVANSLEIGAVEGIYRMNGSVDEVRISNVVRVPEEPEGAPLSPTPTPAPTATPTPTATATPQPATQFVVYVSTSCGYECLIKANPDGSNATQIAGNGSGNHKHASVPRFSPDYSLIGFECHDGDRRLCVMNPDGSNQVELYAFIHHTRWTWIDNDTLLFIGTDNVARTINADGTGLTTVPGWPANYKPSSYCSSNGYILAHYYDGSQNDIYKLLPDGSGAVRLTTDSSHQTGASWSPDCSQIVYQSKQTGAYEIYTMDANGGDQTRITFTPNDEWSIYPRFSPDGSKIIFSTSRWTSGYWEIATMNADGSTVTNISNTSAAEQWNNWGQEP